MSAFGGFGFTTDGDRRPLVQAIKGFRLSLEESNTLIDAVTYREPRRLSFHGNEVPRQFVERIGPPQSGKGVVFPVRGSERVLFLIYADNAEKPRAIAQRLIPRSSCNAALRHDSKITSSFALCRREPRPPEDIGRRPI